jgi:hypothetical protein
MKRRGEMIDERKWMKGRRCKVERSRNGERRIRQDGD